MVMLASFFIIVLAIGNAPQNQCLNVEDSKLATDFEFSILNVKAEQESGLRNLQPNSEINNYQQSEINNSGGDKTNKMENSDIITSKSEAWFEHFLPEWRKIIKAVSDLGEATLKNHGTYGRTILHFLVAEANFDSTVFEDLLKFNADINAVDAYSQTPLHLAVILNKPNVVKFLLDHGADVQCRNKEGSTALHLALFLKYDDIATLLLQHEKQVLSGQSGDPYLSDDDDALHLAIHMNVSESVFQQLLESGKGKNSLQQYDFGWRHVRVAFWQYLMLDNNHGVTDKPKAEAVGVIIKNVGPLIHHAVFKCRKQLLEVLMTAGGNPELKDRDGATPLHIAVEYCPHVVDHLIKAGVPINDQNNFDQTALHLAAKKGDETVIKKLIDAGASLLAKDKQEQTPIVYAEDADQFESANAIKDAITEQAVLELSTVEPPIEITEERDSNQNIAFEEQVLTIDLPTETQTTSNPDSTSDGTLCSSRTYLSASLILISIVAPLVIL